MMKVSFVILMFIVIVVRTHNHYKCVFDQNNQDLRQISRQTPPDVSMVQPNHGRNLQTITRNAIRITTDYSNFSTITAGLNGASSTNTQKLAYILKTTTVGIAFLTKRLKVYPMSSLIAPITCVDHNTPNNDRSIGISGSDLHIYILYTTDKLLTYGATGKSCKYFGDSASLPDTTLQIGRPTMGRIIFNTYNLVDRQSKLSNRLFQSITSTTLHQFMHILGFDSTLYAQWLDSDSTSATFSRNYTNPTVSSNGIVHSSRTDSLFLVTPNVKQWARTFFNCSTLTGMLLENEDGVGLGAGSHWQRAAMYDQIMTATSLGATKGFSALTFAALKDMGWYTVDDSFNQTTNYGYNKGCNFVNQACKGSTSFSQFCNPATQAQISKCQTTFYGKAICSSSGTLSDGCGIYGPYFHCVDPDSTNDGYQSYTLQQYKTNAYCVKSTLGTVALPSTVLTRCYPSECGVSSITFTIGTNIIVCSSTDEGRQFTINSFTGYLECPNFADFCIRRRKTCSNWCSQNGFCMGGICNCIDGYYGADCSQTSCTTGTFYDPIAQTCNSVCPSRYYQNKYDFSCQKCDAICQQCFQEPTICTGCISSSQNPQYFYNTTNQCYSTCPSGTFASGFNCQICEASPALCKTCSVIATNCTSCLNNYFLSQPIYGTCIFACPTIGTYAVSDIVNYVCVDTCDNNLMLILVNGSNTCQYCPNNTYKIIANNTCSSTCPVFTYPKNSQWICDTCDSSCLTCFGRGAQNCLSCSPTNTLKYFLLNMCWFFCPGGYYTNDTIGACQLCPVPLNCANCSYFNDTDSVQCTSCKYGYFYQSSSKICAPTCSSNQYPFYGNNTCLECHGNCLTCFGPGESFCKSCLAPLLLTSNISGSYCISTCNQTGYYNAGSVSCLPCHVSCLNCSGSSVTQCIACSNGTYLSNGECRYVCPPGAYQNVLSNLCSACDGSCTYCFQSTINNCTGCITGMVLYNFTCTLTCPKGYTVNQWNVCFQPYYYMIIIIYSILILLR